MLCLLKDLNLNVLTEEFKTFENNNNFLQLKNIFESAELEKDSLKKLKIIQNLKVHSKSKLEDIGLFGQRLTDLENGIIFKRIINEKYPNIDGYRWKEFNDNRGYTYCLFDSTKLFNKKTIKASS